MQPHPGRDVVDRAEALGDPRTLVAALIAVLNAQTHGGQGDRNMVPFARLLQLWDDDPTAFEDDEYWFFWSFKWVTADMIRHPDVPLPSIRRWLAEMEERYRRAGHGLNAVHRSRLAIAWHLGDADDVRQSFDAWRTSGRDDMSDCLACDQEAEGTLLAAGFGEPEAALRAWAPVLTGRTSCAREPHLTLARSLDPLARLGRPDRAREHHHRGYRLVRGRPDMLTPIGLHLEFAVRSGHPARGLEILAENAPRLARGDEDVEDRMWFLASVVLLLRRLAADGQGGLPVTPGGETAAALLPRLQAEVDGFTARYDRRNGNTRQSELVRRRTDAGPYPAAG